MSGLNLEFLIIIGLASFRMTRLLVFDKIAEFIRAPFFEEVNIEGEVFLEPKSSGMKKWIGELLDCYWCTGVWVSGALFTAYQLIPTIAVPLIWIFAIAGIASFIETINIKIMGE